MSFVASEKLWSKLFFSTISKQPVPPSDSRSKPHPHQLDHPSRHFTGLGQRVITSVAKEPLPSILNGKPTKPPSSFGSAKGTMHPSYQCAFLTSPCTAHALPTLNGCKRNGPIHWIRLGDALRIDELARRVASSQTRTTNTPLKHQAPN